MKSPHYLLLQINLHCYQKRGRVSALFQSNIKWPCKRYKYGKNSMLLTAGPLLSLLTGTVHDSQLHFSFGQLSHNTIGSSLTFCSIGMLKDPVDQTSPSPPLRSPRSTMHPAFLSAPWFSRALICEGQVCADPQLGGWGWGESVGGKKGWAAHKGVPQTRGHRCRLFSGTFAQIF